MTTGEKFLDFNLSLPSSIPVPPGIAVIYPFSDPATRKAMQSFYTKYCNDTSSRIFLLGINPGRFGAGITGIPFTDPVHLASVCGIENDFPKRKELSSAFVYQFIKAFGGAEEFYSRFLISSVCPLGFLKDGKNYNYYDSKKLQKMVEPFIVESIQKQIDLLGEQHAAICIGGGQNFKYLLELNEKHGFFNEIHPVPHPRWVMQYNRKKMDFYCEEYVNLLKKIA